MFQRVKNALEFSTKLREEQVFYHLKAFEFTLTDLAPHNHFPTYLTLVRKPAKQVFGPLDALGRVGIFSQGPYFRHSIFCLGVGFMIFWGTLAKPH